jgi:hypothetical protein
MFLVRLFKYVEPVWTGNDKKVSLRAVLAIAFSIDFIRNLSHAIWKWDAGRSLEGLSLVLGIEAGLIVALLGLRALQNPGSVNNTTTQGEDCTPNTDTKTSKTKVEEVVD